MGVTRHLRVAMVLLASAWPGLVWADAYDDRIAREAWAAIARVEYREGIPLGLLHSMSLVETGMGQDGSLLPWPYTVGINRSPERDFTSVADARRELKRLQDLGFRKYDFTLNGRKRTEVTGTSVALALDGAAQTARITLQGVNYARRFSTAAEAAAFARRMIAGGHNNLDLGIMQINWRVHGKNFRSVEEVFDVNKNLTYAVQYLREHRETRDWWGSVGRYHSATPYYARRYIRNVWNMYQRVHRLNKSGKPA